MHLRAFLLIGRKIVALQGDQANGPTAVYQQTRLAVVREAGRGERGKGAARISVLTG